jgi:hypothetical protein
MASASDPNGRDNASDTGLLIAAYALAIGACAAAASAVRALARVARILRAGLRQMGRMPATR